MAAIVKICETLIMAIIMYLTFYVMSGFFGWIFTGVYEG